MSQSAVAGWLIQMALGGGLVLLLARLVMAHVGAPAARGRLGEVGVLSALLLGALALGPRWLPIALPGWAAPASPVVSKAEPVRPAVPAPLEMPFDEFPGIEPDCPPADLLQPVAPPEAASIPATAVTQEVDWRQWIVTALLAGYAGVAGLFLLRWLLAHAALAWLLRGARPAPASVAEILEELAPGRKSRLVVSPRVRVPFSYGLLRPTMVLPASMADAPPRVLRWVLAHERSHLERGDGWAGLLLALGQAAFFFVPWFWWLRRQVRLCQEHVADAAAVAAGGAPEDYAEFLLGWIAAPRAPLVGTGVFGSSSDLYRRITMLLQGRPVDCDAHSLRWLRGTGAALLSLAVLLAGLHVVPRASAEPDKDEKKAKPDKPQNKGKDDKKPAVPGLPDVDKLLERLPKDIDPAQLKEMRQRLEAMRKQMEQQTEMMRKQIERQTESMRRQMEAQMEMMRRQIEMGQRFNRMPSSVGRETNKRLGAQVRPPEPALVAQLDLPKGQGQVLEEVAPNSPAAKAGMKSHDVLLGLAGKSVPSGNREFGELLKGVKPSAPVDGVVMRKGKKETIKGLSLPEAARPTRGLTQLSSDGSNFSVQHTDAGRIVVVTGKIVKGKGEVTGVRIVGQGRIANYDSLEKVPDADRELVKQLAAMADTKPVEASKKSP
jgi:beta-lactamase regulating signal transducer with metallopeptidase domain